MQNALIYTKKYLIYMTIRLIVMYISLVEQTFLAQKLDLEGGNPSRSRFVPGREGTLSDKSFFNRLFKQIMVMTPCYHAVRKPHLLDTQGLYSYSGPKPRLRVAPLAHFLEFHVLNIEEFGVLHCRRRPRGYSCADYLPC